MKEYYFDETTGLTVIACMQTFACANNRDIVRRLMGTCEMFKDLTFADAMDSFRYAERNGLVRREAEYIVIYHDAN